MFYHKTFVVLVSHRSCSPFTEGHDWSDHALFWPERNQWLLRTKSTLDQYSVDAEATLTFTPMHKVLRVQLPDLRHLDCRVDFSSKCFNAVIDVCKELGRWQGWQSRCFVLRCNN